MGLKQTFKQVRDRYVVEQVRVLEIPQFPPADIHRYRITFSGRVQKVGFRLAVCELAKRLKLTGFCANLENGSVLAELQGTEEKIRYLLAFLDSRKRIKITEKVTEEIALVDGEIEFLKR